MISCYLLPWGSLLGPRGGPFRPPGGPRRQAKMVPFSRGQKIGSEVARGGGPKGARGLKVRFWHLFLECRFSDSSVNIEVFIFFCKTRHANRIAKHMGNWTKSWKCIDSSMFFIVFHQNRWFLMNRLQVRLGRKGVTKGGFWPPLEGFCRRPQKKNVFFSTSRTPPLLDFENCTPLGKSSRFLKKCV